MARARSSLIRDTKEKVLKILKEPSEHREEYRDNDEKLVARFWFEEIKKAGRIPKAMSARDFLTMVAEGKTTPADDIIRARRKIQETMPEFRGKRWNERHKMGEEVKSESQNL